MISLYILLGCMLLAVVLSVAIYNSFVAVRNHCDEAWANIDSELKRRHDLIPNLIATVKGFADHERNLIRDVTKLREQGIRESGVSTRRAEIESQLGDALSKLTVRLEAYPEVRASANFLELQQELSNTEDRIQAAVRFYNGNVRENNTRVDMFPASVIANMFNFDKRDYFKVDPAVRETPQVQF